MGYFTPPIDALLGHGDEEGIWAKCGDRQLRKAFWGSMRVILLIRKDEEQWARLLCGSLERLLPHEQRFACQQYPERSIWVTGDATLDAVSGVRWFAKEFFFLDAPPLIRIFKRNHQEEIIIGECELLATLLISLLWGLAGETPRISIVCTDNLNVFHRLQNWKAKIGTAFRMLQSIEDYLIENKVEITPCYVRIGRNFPCDHLSRTDEEGIRHWPRSNHMTRAPLPTIWVSFCEQWKHEVEFAPNDCSDIRASLREHCREIKCCEWRPSAYTFVARAQRYRGHCIVHEPDHAEVQKQMSDCPEWNGQYVDLLVGLVWADVELGAFAHDINHICPSVDVAITPITLFWTQSRALECGRIAFCLHVCGACPTVPGSLPCPRT